MATKTTSSPRRRSGGSRRRPMSNQSRAALIQWLALGVIAVLAVLAAFVLLSDGSTSLTSF